MKQYDLYMAVTSEKNLLFSKYDIDIFYDDIKIGSVDNGETFEKKYAKKQEAFAKMSDHVNESISAERVIKAFVQEKKQDEAFGLIETAEKGAEVYMKIAHLPWKQTITDEQLHQLEERFGVKGREGYLDWAGAAVRCKE